MDPTVAVVFVAVWVAVGLITGGWMVRRGHDPRWLLIAVALGPIFVPVALERVERRPRLAGAGPDGIPAPRGQTPGGPRVLVGTDGSPEAEQALRTAVGLLGAHCGVLVLAEVVSYDATEADTRAALDAARPRLATTATELADEIPLRFEVLAGPPGPALRRFAEDQDMDLVVVGRRGRGLSARLLGSVSADLVQHSPVPVLVVEPAARPAPADTPRRQRSAPPPAR
ncbi:universal stress protein [Saccharomonospora piscinae]|uniref:universal stress protein n=1 Tax=Saccharomonospora piscinae TaxID=687388 RepID=UPI0004641E42|nr:universal stress protein [Saccharomonospora piscinae]